MYHKVVNIIGFDPTDQVLNLVGSTVLLTNIIVEALQPNWLTICIGVSLVAFNLSRVYYYIKKAHKKEEENNAKK